MRSQMSIEYFVCRVWRFFSIVAALAALFFAYTTLPESVFVDHVRNKPTESLSKSNVFYVVTGLLLIINVLIGFLENAFAQLPDQRLSFLTATGWNQVRTELNMRFSNWLRLLQGGMNFFVVLTIYALTMVNLPDTKKTINDYQWILYVGAFGLIIWLFWLPLRILFLKPKVVVGV
ncbi:MAG: hypothetical protein U0Y10_26160 [Spirosomataceae bacterium]